MTKYQAIALDSYDLAHYAVEVPCLVCDGGNNYDAERCRHCCAPLALTYQADGKQKTAPKMLAMIGPAGCGKTVYLGMLTDILSRQQASLRVLARGAFSVALQQQSLSLLARRRFPNSTGREPEHWNWMHYQVAETGRRRKPQFVLPDMSGEAIADEIEHGSSVVIRAFLKKCVGAILILDAEQLESGDQTPDFFGMKVISYLHELGNCRKTSWAHRPVAVVFTKADRSQSCFDDPQAYAEVHTRGLWRQCQERLKQHAFFATSVVGARAGVAYYGESVPLALRIEPRRITPPLEWLLRKTS